VGGFLQAGISNAMGGSEDDRIKFISKCGISKYACVWKKERL
jgi:uncharacterized protein YaaQ